MICDYPAKLADLSELKQMCSEEEMMIFNSFFLPFLVDGSEAETDFVDPVFLSVKINLAHGQMIASSCEKCRNVELTVRKKTVFVKALKTLNPGDRLFLSYGDDYWGNSTDVKDPVCPVCKTRM